MKCQNCGKNEINFHYSSNINGSVTEAHLCSECASKAGYNFGHMFDTRRIASSFFPFFANRSIMPMQVMMMGMPEYHVAQQAGIQQADNAHCRVCETKVQESSNVEVDGEMQKRREINVIREQMRIAADNEDYEKAAQLRDQVRQLEADQQ